MCDKGTQFIRVTNTLLLPVSALTRIRLGDFSKSYMIWLTFDAGQTEHKVEGVHALNVLAAVYADWEDLFTEFPNTTGALLDIVRRAYYDPDALWNGRIEVQQDAHNVFFVVQPYYNEDGSLDHKQISCGATEAEALVNAWDAKKNSKQKAKT